MRTIKRTQSPRFQGTIFFQIGAPPKLAAPARSACAACQATIDEGPGAQGHTGNRPLESLFVHSENPWPSYQRTRTCERDRLRNRKYAEDRGSLSSIARHKAHMPSIPLPNETDSCTTKISQPAGNAIMPAPPQRSARVRPHQRNLSGCSCEQAGPGDAEQIRQWREPRPKSE